MDSNVQQISWFDDRFYRVVKDDGTVVFIPSVTTKLGATAKPYLIQWYGSLGLTEAQRRKEEAADRGSRIHHAYHVFKTGGAVLYQPFERPTYTKEQMFEIENKYPSITVLYNQEEMYQVYKLQKLYEILKPKVVFSEHIVYSLETMDAGQVDDIWHLEQGEYKVNGKEPLVIEESGLYINDLKSGKEIDDDSFMQTACYLKLASSMGLGDFKGTIVTHTNAKTRTGIEGLGVYLRTLPEVEADYADYRHVSTIWERKFGNIKPKVFDFPSLIAQKGE